jgi:hypothetical protein
VVDSVVGWVGVGGDRGVQDNSGMGRGEQGMEYHKKVPLIGDDGEVPHARTHARTCTQTNPHDADMLIC